MEVDTTPPRPLPASGSEQKLRKTATLSAAKLIRRLEQSSGTYIDDSESTFALKRQEMTASSAHVVATQRCHDINSELVYYKHRSELAEQECEHLNSELAYSKRRFELVEQECEDLKNDKRHRENFYTSTKGIPKKMLKELDHYTRKSTSLNKKLNCRVDYLTLDNVESQGPKTGQILSAFQAMRDKVASMIVLGGATKLTIGGIQGQSEDLDMLLRALFGVGCRGNVQRTLVDSTEYTVLELVQALTGASLHHWVFENEYRLTGMTNTPLLQKYRDHISTLCTYHPHLPCRY